MVWIFRIEMILCWCFKATQYIWIVLYINYWSHNILLLLKFLIWFFLRFIYRLSIFHHVGNTLTHINRVIFRLITSFALFRLLVDGDASTRYLAYHPWCCWWSQQSWWWLLYLVDSRLPIFVYYETLIRSGFAECGWCSIVINLFKLTFPIVLFVIIIIVDIVRPTYLFSIGRSRWSHKIWCVSQWVLIRHEFCRLSVVPFINVHQIALVLIFVALHIFARFTLSKNIFEVIIYFLC